MLIRVLFAFLLTLITAALEANRALPLLNIGILHADEKDTRHCD